MSGAFWGGVPIFFMGIATFGIAAIVGLFSPDPFAALGNVWEEFMALLRGLFT